MHFEPLGDFGIGLFRKKLFVHVIFVSRQKVDHVHVVIALVDAQCAQPAQKAVDAGVDQIVGFLGGFACLDDAEDGRVSVCPPIGQGVDADFDMPIVDEARVFGHAAKLRREVDILVGVVLLLLDLIVAHDLRQQRGRGACQQCPKDDLADAHAKTHLFF